MRAEGQRLRDSQVQQMALDLGARNRTADSEAKSYAKQDYGMQLMLLDQQNKKRLLMRRQQGE